MPAEIGSPAPDFALRNYDKSLVSLADLRGRKALIVFIPLPFTRTCTSELCSLQDNLATFDDAQVVAITCDTIGANGAWAREEGTTYPILSDFWPHGAVSQAYGCFNETSGTADRATFVLDDEGVVRDIIRSESYGTARPIESYTRALGLL